MPLFAIRSSPEDAPLKRLLLGGDFRVDQKKSGNLGFVSGHDFQPCRKVPIKTGLQPGRVLHPSFSCLGGDFSLEVE